MNPIVAMAEAYDFAAAKHIAQRRKGEAAEPYMNHLTEVAALAAIGSGGDDVELVMAAVLHDTVEDTKTTPAELSERFGARVAGLVAEVTDDKSLPKAERKRLQIEHAAHASKAAKIIKLADKTSNLRALLASPPADWEPERKTEYVDWARRVVAGCRGASPWLEAQFDQAVDAIGASALRP
ncbi:MAG TPA: HD domain-containing protein [Caulobacteraceae bacterium]|jgi:(p)ppGpp synthase/HD superfamily hydrolase|nr:HD domain-containing protein [Caulobacteraceae bacterium]